MRTGSWWLSVSFTLAAPPVSHQLPAGTRLLFLGISHTVPDLTKANSRYDQDTGIIKLNLWLTSPKGATPVDYISAIDCQMAARRDVICITPGQV